MADGTPIGIAFHDIPSGHEFTSFVLGLYNAAGPGQALDEETKQMVRNIEQAIDMKILVTLSCTMCPDLVINDSKVFFGKKSICPIRFNGLPVSDERCGQFG